MSSVTQRLNSSNLLTNKNGLENILEQFADEIKKPKKSTEKLELNFP